MNILVTGGAGYIGSHTLVELYSAGHTALVVDNLCNSNPIALDRVAKIIGVENIPFYEVDIRDKAGLEKVFAGNKVDACIHFAGLKAVGESVEKPLEYYENNVAGTLTLVEVMRNHGCKNIIFSPEFLNRIDELILFSALSTEDLKKIAEIMLSSLAVL